MGKDPAFLFYSKDWYEGTRMMLPEERACFIDLLVFQHQNGGCIPNDLRRLTMYCSGCDIATIQNVLDQKFKQTPNGWFNQKLNHLVNERAEHKPKKTAASSFAGLISSCNLNQRQKNKIKKSFLIDDFILENGELISDETLIKQRVREWFKNMVNQMVNNLGNANANANGNINKEKGKGGMGEKPMLMPELNLIELGEEAKAAYSWRENICRTYSKTGHRFGEEELDNYLEQFFETLTGDNDMNKTWKDFTKHFNRWLKIEIEKQAKKDGISKTKVKYSDDFLRKITDKVRS